MNTYIQAVMDACSVADRELAAKDKVIASLIARGPRTILGGLHLMPMFVEDKKIPYQWIQPGNVGNDPGGASSLAHGSLIWTPGAPTLIECFPKNIAPKSDNFFCYMCLPFPAHPPTLFRLAADNYSARTPADWLRCQQAENQLEIVSGGFRRNMAWRINPRDGLGYYDKLNETWVPFRVKGKPVLVDLGQPTRFVADFAVDYVHNTVTHVNVQINDQVYQVGVTQPSPKAAGQEFTVSVQPDCQANAGPYAMVLDGLYVEYQ